MQSGAESTDTFRHTLIVYKITKGWNAMHQLYVKGKQFINYVLCLMDNIFKMVSFIFSRLS